MEALREEYQSLCQKFEELKTLARINLDLLFLTVNKVESPQAWVELDKVNDLVQAVLAGWEESSKVESSTLILSDHKPPLMDTKPIDRYLDEMALSFTQQEVMDAFNRFLERSSLKELSSTPGFTPSEDQEQSNSAALPHGSDINGAACVKAEIGEGSHQDVDGVSDNSVGAGDRIPAGDMTDVMEMDDQTEDNPEGSQKDSETLDLESPSGRSGLDCVPVVNDDPAASKVSIAWEVVIIPDAPSESDGKDEEERLPQDQTDEDCHSKGTQNEGGTHESPSSWSDTEDNDVTIQEAPTVSGGTVEHRQQPSLQPSWEVAMIEATKEQVAIQRLLEEFDLPLSLLESDSEKVCPTCGKEYKVKYKFLDHLKSHKQEKGVTLEQLRKGQMAAKNLLEEFGLPSTLLDPGSPKVCPVCNKEYKFKSQFLVHLKNHKQQKGFVIAEIREERIAAKNLLEEFGLSSSLLDSTGTMLCPICNKIYKIKSKFLEHLRNHKQEKGVVIAEIREQQIDTKNLLEGFGLSLSILDPSSTKVCPVCNKEYKLRTKFLEHLKQHRQEKDLYDSPTSWQIAMDEMKKEQAAMENLLEEFGLQSSILESSGVKICPLCKKEYKLKKAFVDHLKFHKREKATVAAELTEEQIANKNLLEEFNLSLSILDSGSTKICPVCSKEYKLKNKFLEHLKNHKEEKEREENLDESKPESFLCTICGKTLNGKSSLKSHVILHKVMDKGEYFKCQTCDKEFLGKRNLKRHILNVHTLKKAFMCDICGKGYTNKYYFQVHQKYVHSDVKPEQCQVCKKMLSSKDSLVRHMRIHRGELPYSCSLCGKAFRSSTSKNTHEVVVHTGNFPYRCSLCDHHGFISPGLLRKHEQKYHPHGEGGTAADGDKKRKVRPWHRKRWSLYGEPLEPWKCKTCGKEFKDWKSLNRHEFIHTGIKPHKCSICGRCFSMRPHLDRHLWTHSNVKKYLCEICNKGFNDRSYYVSHLKHIHPEHADVIVTPVAIQVTADTQHMDIKPSDEDQVLTCLLTEPS